MRRKDDWEGLTGNCDTAIFLGGNDYATAEYFSKRMGKQTERTKSQSVGKGSHGSSSDSTQTAGRELCMPDELLRLHDDECLIMMRSELPVIDKKYDLMKHDNIKYTPDGHGRPYVMPDDFMSQSTAISLDTVDSLAAREITEEMYEELEAIKHEME